jgi:hypothetical protein
VFNVAWFGDAATAAVGPRRFWWCSKVWGSGSGIGCEARDGFAPGRFDVVYCTVAGVVVDCDSLRRREELERDV